MPQVTFGRGGIRIDGKYVPFVGGQLDYYRNDHIYWEPALDLMKQVGLLFVSAFICWDFHEISPGEFDFEGRTHASRNLLAFLEACARRELYVVARPGPIIDSDWRTRGPAPDVCTLERLDPRFLTRASQWIAAVGNVLRPYQVNEGGPIALTVLDNTILFPYASDPEAYDTDGVTVIPYNEEVVMSMYAEWLKAEYQDISRLNRAWGGDFRDFNEISSPKYDSKANSVEVLDSFEFINDRVRTYLDWVAGEYRKAGIVVPMTTSERQFLAYIDWPRVGRAVDGTGPYFHAPNLLPADQIRMVSWWARLQRAHHNFCWCPEFQAGWIGLDGYFGFISPEHDRYMGLLGFAFGIRGLSWFMFVERDEWCQSPINGVARPRWNRLRQYEGLIDVIKRLDPEDRHMANVGLIWTLEDHQLHAAKMAESWTDLFKVWLNLKDPKEAEVWWSVFRSLEDHDVDFVLYDPRGDQPPPAVLVWAGSSGLTANVAERLASDVEAGSQIISVAPLQESMRRGERSTQANSRPVDYLNERVRQCDVSDLQATLRLAGERKYASTQGDGVLSLAYQGENDVTIFVINNRVEETEVEMKLDAELTNGNVMLRDLAPWRDSQTQMVAAKDVWRFALPPKSVRILRGVPELQNQEIGSPRRRP
jgi:hypothetical protein